MGVNGSSPLEGFGKCPQRAGSRCSQRQRLGVARSHPGRTERSWPPESRLLRSLSRRSRARQNVPVGVARHRRRVPRLASHVDDRASLCDQQRHERVPQVVWPDIRFGCAPAFAVCDVEFLTTHTQLQGCAGGKEPRERKICVQERERGRVRASVECKDRCGEISRVSGLLRAFEIARPRVRADGGAVSVSRTDNTPTGTRRVPALERARSHARAAGRPAHRTVARTLERPSTRSWRPSPTPISRGGTPRR